jgi:hypothetical protein
MDDVQLPTYGLIFFNHLVGEFESLGDIESIIERVPEGQPSPPSRQAALRAAYDRAKALRDAYKSGSVSLTWGDLYGFERDIIELTPKQSLRERLWSVEKRYSDIGTNADYAEHVRLCHWM